MRISVRGLLIGIALLPLARAGAQGPLVVDPASVATVGVRVAAHGVRRSVSGRYRIVAHGRTRVFGEREGMVTVDSSGVGMLPVTFTTPADVAAGLTDIARILVTWPDATTDTTELRVVIKTVHRLDVALSADPPTVPEAGSSRIVFRVANRGNAPDTVHLAVDAGTDWRARWAEQPVVVALGAEVVGTIEVAPLERARAGETRTIVLWATGVGGARQASVVMHVVRDAGPLPGLAQIPATVFVGTGGRRADAPTSIPAIVAVDAGGEIAPGTDLTLRYRHAPSLIPPAFHASVNGPGFQIGVRAPSWNAAAGEVFSLGSALTGYYLQGLGARAGATTGRVVSDVFVAQPEPLGDIGRTQRTGHITRGNVGLRTNAGTLGVTLFDAARPARPGMPLAEVQSAAVRFEPTSFGESRVEAGVVRLRSPSGEAVSGAAIDAAYGGGIGRTGVTVRGKATPGVIPGGDGSDRSVAASTVTPLTRHLSLDVVVDHQSAPRGADSSLRRTSEAGVGVRYFDAGRTYALRTTASRNSAFALGGAAVERRGLVALASVPVGRATLDASLETGQRVHGDTTTWVSGYRTGVRWLGSAGWGWIGMSQSVDEFASTTTRADLAGSLNAGPYSVDGGGGFSLGAGRRSSTVLWTGITAQIAQGTAVVMGLEYGSQGLGSGWRTAIGVRRRLALPLPLPPSPAIAGVVFEDLNGNGRRDPGEPGVGGVSVSVDGVGQTTDRGGRFSFLTASQGAPVLLDATTLPQGAVTLAAPGTAAMRRVDIPVVRGATLTLRVTASSQGLIDGDTTGGVSMATATVVDASGRTRDATAGPDGLVVFRDLNPGEYRVTVLAPERHGTRPSETSLSLSLTSGESIVRDVRVDGGRREIRGLDGTRFDQQHQPKL